MLGQVRQNAWRKYGPDYELAGLMRNRLPPPLADRLGALGLARTQLIEVTRVADEDEARDVAACRELGCSWTMISAALGLQHRKAADRYANRLQVTRTVTVRP